MAREDFFDPTPPIAVPVGLVAEKAHPIIYVKGKPKPVVVIKMEDGSTRPPFEGEIRYEAVAGE